MFENCTLKYIARDGVNISVKVTYPSEGNTTKILSVPIDNENTDYQNILQWVADGNTIQESE
tara:strand:- start:1793 stop:1978 length:186 start_codon:yes stop_codon:yes gene_type:complete